MYVVADFFDINQFAIRLPVTVGAGTALQDTYFNMQQQEFSTSIDPNYYAFLESGLTIEFPIVNNLMLGIGVSYWYQQRIVDFRPTAALDLQPFEKNSIRTQFQIQYQFWG